MGIMERMKKIERMQKENGRAEGPIVDVVFDATSGISLEDQEEILIGINTMTIGGPLSPEAEAFRAKKKGVLFPLVVNVSSLVVFVAAFFLLAFFYGNEEEVIRESRGALGTTERFLIQEIRLQTQKLLSEKENEMYEILSRLSAASEEYQILVLSVDTENETQRERAEYLYNTLEELRASLLKTQNERMRIIEDSRREEAVLRFSVAYGGDRSGRVIEGGEFSLLGDEQERAGRAEIQMTGFYTVLRNEIQGGRLSEASAVLLSMRDFLDAPSLKGIRAFEARKQSHLAAISAIEEVLGDIRYSLNDELSSPGIRIREQEEALSAFRETIAEQDETLAGMKLANFVLEQKAAGLERDIIAMSAEGSSQVKIIAEYSAELRKLEAANSNLEAANSRLFAANSRLEETLFRRDSELASLRADNTSKDQQLASLNVSVASLSGQLQAAQGRIAETDSQLAEQRRENTSRLQEIASLTNNVASLNRQLEAALSNAASLGSRLESASSRIVETEANLAEQRRENSSLATLVASLNRQLEASAARLGETETALTEQRRENTSRVQEVASLTSNVSSLNRQLETANATAISLGGQLQTANTRLSETETALAEQRRDNVTLTTQRDDLRRQYNDLQQRLDTALRLFQGD